MKKNTNKPEQSGHDKSLKHFEEKTAQLLKSLYDLISDLLNSDEIHITSDVGDRLIDLQNKIAKELDNNTS